MKNFCARGECEKRDLQAEIERLRAYLEDIIKAVEATDIHSQGVVARNIARAALRQKEE